MKAAMDDAAEPEGEAVPEASDATHWLCPQCLVLTADPNDRACGCEPPLRPVRLLQGRGTNCPVCRSRYGRFDVITPVSLGNSSALTHVSRTLLRELPPERRKLLIFTDSRQDAAHQARFMQGAERLLRLRRFIHSALESSPAPHDLRWLEERVYQKYVDAGDFTARCSRDERERRRHTLDGDLLHEFVIAPNVRQSLERLGLVEIGYSQLDEELHGDDFARVVRDQQLDFDQACLGVKRLLDLFRTRRAIAHEAMQRYLRGNDPLAREYNISERHQAMNERAATYLREISARNAREIGEEPPHDGLRELSLNDPDRVAGWLRKVLSVQDSCVLREV